MLTLNCSILCMFILSVIWSSSQPVDLCSHTSASKLSIPNPMKHIVKVTQSCLTLSDPMDYVVHGILQARILEWVAVPFSRGSSQPRDRSQHCRGILYQLSYQGSRKHIVKHPKRTFISKSLAPLWAYLYPNSGKRNWEVV